MFCQCEWDEWPRHFHDDADGKDVSTAVDLMSSPVLFQGVIS